MSHGCLPLIFPLFTLVFLDTFADASLLNTSHFRDSIVRLSSSPCQTECWCESDTVDCSWGKLNDIPRGLPVETRVLLLQFNYIDSLFHSTRFRNLSRLQFLNLSHNEITNLGDPDFRDLVSLQVLNLAYNKITTLRDSDFTHLVSLQVLNLAYNKITTLLDSEFIHLGNLWNLDLSFNWIIEINRKAFMGLWGLRCLDLSSNPLLKLWKGFLYPLVNVTELYMTSTRARFDPEDYLTLINLRKFVFQESYQMRFPRFVYNRKSLFPKLVELRMDGNSFDSIDLFGLDSLQFLSVTSNRGEMFLENTFTNLTRLRNMNLSHNCIDNAVICSDSLRTLDLSYSILNFIRSVWASNVFNCIPNLEELLLGHVRVSRLHQPFRNLKKLKNLNLEDTKIDDAWAMHLLSGLTRLEWLSLHENRISTLSREMFEDFSSTLKVLILSSNRITTLDITSLPVQLWTSLKGIDLSDNPFTCDCQLTWFLRWFSSTNVSTNVSGSMARTYQCNAPETQRNKLLRNVTHLTEKDCFEETIYWYIIAAFLLVILACASSTFGSILYRFRWHLKYWYFKHKLQRRQNAVSSDDRYYEYDAFVSYCEHDTHWVVTELRRHLETEEEGIRLCIHDRDFQVGEDIVSNIISCIEQSCKVLLVVSNAFAASQWCHFELARVQTRMLEDDRDNLVLILLEELNDVDVPPRLKLQMDKKTNVEWTSSRIGRQLFWEKLRQELGRPPQSVVNSHLPIELFRSGSH